MAMDSATIILMRWPSHTVQVTHMASPLLLEETALTEKKKHGPLYRILPSLLCLFLIILSKRLDYDPVN
jgi:hypothetical protein